MIIGYALQVHDTIGSNCFFNPGDYLKWDRDIGVTASNATIWPTLEGIKDIQIRLKQPNGGSHLQCNYNSLIMKIKVVEMYDLETEIPPPLGERKIDLDL